ncbi:MAG: hypothetical protein J6D13_01325 [Clostridium sp.]|nr:hypothetical protein [Clostridium sp.]
MLEFLQTGKAVSVLAAICLIGIVTKCITRSLYKRLLKETDNMAMTRNKNLKVLKQKLENTYRLNQNIVNSRAYLEKLMYEFRFMHVSLDGWNNISAQMILLGLLAGGAGSFLSYWYRLDASFIVLYASLGALSGLFLMFLDSCFHIGQKQQKLETILLEYVDNSVFVRAARENASREPVSREPVSRNASYGGPESASSCSSQLYADREQIIRENEIKDGLVREETPRRASVRTLRGRNAKAEDLMRTVRTMKDEPEETASPARRDIDSLKQRLEQIAASREKERGESPRGAESPGDRDWTKDLTKDEVKLIGEIMRQYFSGS